MSFIEKALKKRQQLRTNNKEGFEPDVQLESGEILQKEDESDNELKIILCTDKKLSDQQKDTIITIVKDGISNNAKQTSICIRIIMNTGVGHGMILNRIDNCVQVII